MTRQNAEHGGEKWQPANPDAELFTTFERLEVCHRVEVTEENMAAIAKTFGWSVNYATGEPRLWEPGGRVVDVGSWIDHKGSRWNPEPLTQGWSPSGTYTRVTPSAPTHADEGGA